MANKSYAGKVSNKGAQEVKALYPQGKPKGATVKKGGDLRSKKSDK